MKKQDIFNTVALHLLAQKAKATTAREDLSYSCRYRTASGLKCAVGCLIPDELYTESLEGASVHGIIMVARHMATGSVDPINDPYLKNVKITKEQADLFMDLLEEDGSVHLLEELQVVHDVRQIHEWRMELSKLAAEEHLDAAVLNTTQHEA